MNLAVASRWATVRSCPVPSSFSSKMLWNTSVSTLYIVIRIYLDVLQIKCNILTFVFWNCSGLTCLLSMDIQLNVLGLFTIFQNLTVDSAKLSQT